jgi:hypothetical protein
MLGWAEQAGVPEQLQQEVLSRQAQHAAGGEQLEFPAIQQSAALACLLLVQA